MLGLHVGCKEVPKRVADVAVTALVGLLFADENRVHGFQSIADL